MHGGPGGHGLAGQSTIGHAVRNGGPVTARVAEDRFGEGCVELHIGGHHQHIVRPQRGISGEGIEQLIAQHLHFAQWRVGRMHRKRAVVVTHHDRRGRCAAKCALQLLQHAVGRNGGAVGDMTAGGCLPRGIGRLEERQQFA